MKRFNIPICVLLTLSIAIIIEFMKVWQLLAIAGIIGGALAKDLKSALLSGLIGLVSCWSLVLLFLWGFYSYAAGIAYVNLSTLLALGLLFIGVLGFLSAATGHLLATFLIRLADHGT